MRKKFVGGNWKMCSTTASARQLATAVVRGVGREERVRVAVCPPFPYLLAVAEIVRGSAVELGGQNFYPETEGAFTGEVSPAMLLDAGCKYAIVGHSERRHKLCETDAFINRKVLLGLRLGLHIILCVGETLQEREAGCTNAILQSQLDGSLANVEAGMLTNLVIAYEPVWAIGTGKNATPDQAQEVHAFLRSRIAEKFSEVAAQALPIQYGGSVKPDNAARLMSQPDVDGALVGGASLKADEFLAIVRAAVGLGFRS
jgi:triosephosphate isomerase (TIM)